MGIVSLERFLEVQGNAVPVAVYANGEAADDLRKAMSDLPKHWAGDCACLEYDQDLAVMFTSSAQAADLLSEVETEYEFLEILDARAFRPFGLPADARVGQGLFARRKPASASGDDAAYRLEMNELAVRSRDLARSDRRSQELHDRRVGRLGRRIEELERMVETLRAERQVAIDAWKASGVGDRRQSDDRRDRAGGDRREGEAKDRRPADGASAGRRSNEQRGSTERRW